MLRGNLSLSNSAEQCVFQTALCMNASQLRPSARMRVDIQCRSEGMRLTKALENSFKYSFVRRIELKVGQKLFRRVSIEPSPAASSEVTSGSDWSKVETVLEKLRRDCNTPAELLYRLIDGMVEEMKAGLAKEGGSKDFKMILTYVDKLPFGKENGHFYALDLGGTNFRVLRVSFGVEASPAEFQEVSIPQELMLGQHEQES
ncbi:hypothetical protein KP509_20G004000 [Ceratopteris richardii]|uniref:Phosphotransferase n=1 Tax=Ceratopteris richardii TaxID=49495 RepID=A0A8T2SGC8_CERRI|nr:hypothetical protein KP509_20G004000 [Ceratopteris richardii]